METKLSEKQMKLKLRDIQSARKATLLNREKIQIRPKSLTLLNIFNGENLLALVLVETNKVPYSGNALSYDIKFVSVMIWDIDKEEIVAEYKKEGTKLSDSGLVVYGRSTDSAVKMAKQIKLAGIPKTDEQLKIEIEKTIKDYRNGIVIAGSKSYKVTEDGWRDFYKGNEKYVITRLRVSGSLDCLLFVRGRKYEIEGYMKLHMNKEGYYDKFEQQWHNGFEFGEESKKACQELVGGDIVFISTPFKEDMLPSCQNTCKDNIQKKNNNRSERKSKTMEQIIDDYKNGVIIEGEKGFPVLEDGLIHFSVGEKRYFVIRLHVEHSMDSLLYIVDDIKRSLEGFIKIHFNEGRYFTIFDSNFVPEFNFGIEAKKACEKLVGYDILNDSFQLGKVMMPNFNIPDNNAPKESLLPSIPLDFLKEITRRLLAFSRNDFKPHLVKDLMPDIRLAMMLMINMEKTERVAILCESNSAFTGANNLPQKPYGYVHYKREENGNIVVIEEYRLEDVWNHHPMINDEKFNALMNEKINGWAGRQWSSKKYDNPAEEMKQTTPKEKVMDFIIREDAQLISRRGFLCRGVEYTAKAFRSNRDATQRIMVAITGNSMQEMKDCEVIGYVRYTHSMDDLRLNSEHKMPIMRELLMNNAFNTAAEYIVDGWRSKTSELHIWYPLLENEPVDAPVTQEKKSPYYVIDRVTFEDLCNMVKDLRHASQPYPADNKNIFDWMVRFNLKGRMGNCELSLIRFSDKDCLYGSEDGGIKIKIPIGSIEWGLPKMKLHDLLALKGSEITDVSETFNAEK